MYKSLMLNLFLEPFLNNGVMFASFHSKRTAPSLSDKLNTLLSGILLFPLVVWEEFHRVQVIYYPSLPLFS